MRSRGRPVVVGVAGGSGSGKSTVVEELVRLVGVNRTAIMSHDAYYRDHSHLEFEARTALNYDHPHALETGLMVQHLEALLAGNPVDVPVYDYATHTRSSEEIRVEPAPILIVEGILVLAESGLRELMDVRVFVDVGEQERLERRVARDREKRGRSQEMTAKQHRESVQPMHAQFVEPSREWADLLITGGGQNRDAIEILVARVNAAVTDSTRP